ncbi:MAG: lysylphosphatidylglycerol synthase transmembrane domain-containing protein [Candidatus Parvarchaeota archaeon]|nr:flippase-like domain-containing protein [Candidatus Parvarchaeota archaeon]
MRRLLNLNNITLIIGIALLIWLISEYNFGAAIREMQNARPIFLIYAFIAFLIFPLLKFIPWYYVIRKLGIKLRKTISLLTMYAYFGLGIIPAAAGQLILLKGLERFKKRYKYFSGNIVISLTLTDFLSVSIIALLTAIIVSKYVAYTIAVVAVAYVIASILGLNRTNDLILRAVRRFGPLKRFTKYVETMRNRSVLSQKDILYEMITFFPTIIAEGSLIFFILLALNQNVSLAMSLFIFSFSAMVGSISMIPFGIGSMDAVIIALLLTNGVPGVISISTVVIFRIFNTILPTGISYGIFTFLQGKKQNKKIH